MRSHKLQGIEAGRGIAACLVALYHTTRHLQQDVGPLWLGAVFQFGHAGVDFFFVLSGFIIMFVHERDLGRPARLGAYALKRFVRIYPIYWVVVTVYVVLMLLKQAEYSWTALVVDYTLLPLQGTTAVGVAWTLQHEVLFYALFAVAIVSRTLGAVLLALWTALLLLAMVTDLQQCCGFAWAVLVSPFNIEFIMGLAAAYILRRQVMARPLTLLVIALAALLGVAVIEGLGLFDGYSTLARLAYGSIALCVVLGLVEAERSQRLRVPRLLVVMGRASYSIYLLHLLCIGVAYKILGLLGWLTVLPVWATFLVLALAAIIGSTLISQWVEYPLMGLVRRRMTGTSAATAPAR